MNEKEFFYIDRPAVPATQQNLIDIDALRDHSVPIDPSDIHAGTVLFASEIKDSDGNVVGTVLYAPGRTFEQLVDVSSDVMMDDGEVEEEVEEEALSMDGESETSVIPDVADLELELAEARQVVQDIEDEISALRQDESGC